MSSAATATESLTELRDICSAVRAELCRHDGDLVAMCLPASLVLTDRLRAAGFHAHLALGSFALDCPDPETFDECDEERAFAPVHYWVTVGRVLCDITADQFADECDGDLPEAVTVAELGSDAAWRWELYQLDPDVDFDAAEAAWMLDQR